MFGFKFMYMFILVVISVTFMYKCKAAWLAKQHMGVEDGEINVEL